jgi:hypothetical protein
MTVTRLTQRYISERPSVRDCLKRGLINFSALTREICLEFGEEHFDAVLAACRRYYQRIHDKESLETRVRALLRTASMRTRNQIAVAIVEKPKDFERLHRIHKQVRQNKGDFHLIEGSEVVVVITNHEYTAEIREAFRGRIKKLTLDLVQISMIFDERLESTPGVVSFIYSVLAEQGINVIEEMSCWTELMMVIAEEDAARTVRILNSIAGRDAAMISPKRKKRPRTTPVQ